MKRHVFAWYILAGIVVLGPAAVRMGFWTSSRPLDVDVASAQTGRMLFMHEWTVKDPLSPSGDGLGPVFNATSCVACHNQGGVGGGSGLDHNVTTYIKQFVEGCNFKVRQGVVHSHAISPEFQETLFNVDPNLPKIAQPSLQSMLPDANDLRVRIRGRDPGPDKLNIPDGVHLSQRNTPALFGARLIEELPDRVIIAQQRAQQLRWGMAKGESVPVGRVIFLANGRVGKFGWKSQSARLLDFVEGACANELGLGNPGQPQPASAANAAYLTPGLDLTSEQCQQMADFIASLPAPSQRVPDDEQERGRINNGQSTFMKVGCAECHTPNIGSINGIYSDLLLHRMGQDLEGTGGYNSPPVVPGSDNGPLADEWRTPPLWGVADSAPYLHDGRAATLEEAIRLHGGQGHSAAEQFRQLSGHDRNDVILFLKSLRAPS